MRGSAARATHIHDRQFDKLVFVENDPVRCVELYRESPQGSLFGDVHHERTPGVTSLLDIYKNKLAHAFGNRFLLQSRTLRNSRNAPLFEFLFRVGSQSPKAIGAAQRIAGHILEKL